MAIRPANKTTPTTTLDINVLKLSNCRIFIFRLCRLLETKDSEKDSTKEAHIGLETLRQEQKGVNCQK
jgi:hypothetical protein